MRIKTSYPILLLLLVTPVLGHSYKYKEPRKPNIVFIIVDQWRAQALGYSGDKNAFTPNLDKLAATSLNVSNAVSGTPVCTPYRASLLTGQNPLTHGVFMNDVGLDPGKTTLAKIFKSNGYNTGFIGKWHIDGHGRRSYIPESRRQGFDYWKALEVSHDYNHSEYFSGNSDKRLIWEGYDAIAQTDDACNYIKTKSKEEKPFLLFVSIGPPHDPYQTAPDKYRKLYDNKNIEINPNVPAQFHDKATQDLKGYYSHIAALDECVGKIWQNIKDAGIEENTMIVFTADHGDMLGSHGSWNKQQPYAESIKVPFLIHYPAALGRDKKTSSALLNSSDIMPTLLGFSNLPIPKTVEGVDFSGVFRGNKKDMVKETLIACYQPFGQWNRKRGGKEFRGLVTTQYTYVRDLKGSWLLFDNLKDPFQLNNLIGKSDYQKVEKDLENRLSRILVMRKDDFKPGMEYVKKWHYVVDETETVPYDKINFEGKPIVE
ncbi:MAG: sulfatase [Segetibacter sp.]